MVDKSDQEMNAIKQVFGAEQNILLCDFHRLQAQWRWIKKSENGVPNSR
jgi:hypothetical protein